MVRFPPMTVTMPASHNRRKSGVFSGVVSAKSPLTSPGRAKRRENSRLEPLDGECRRRSGSGAALGDTNPVVHPVLPALPELDDLRGDQVATPVRRDRDGVLAGEPGGHLV